MAPILEELRSLPLGAEIRVIRTGGGFDIEARLTLPTGSNPDPKPVATAWRVTERDAVWRLRAAFGAAVTAARAANERFRRTGRKP